MEYLKTVASAVNPEVRKADIPTRRIKLNEIGTLQGIVPDQKFGSLRDIGKPQSENLEMPGAKEIFSKPSKEGK
jgi:hypothetical protein